MPAGHAFSYATERLSFFMSSELAKDWIYWVQNCVFFIPNEVVVTLLKEWGGSEILHTQQNIFSLLETNLKATFRPLRPLSYELLVWVDFPAWWDQPSLNLLCGASLDSAACPCLFGSGKPSTGHSNPGVRHRCLAEGKDPLPPPAGKALSEGHLSFFFTSFCVIYQDS